MASRIFARLLPLVAAVAAACAHAAPATTTTEIRYLSGKGSDDAVEWDFQISEGRRAGEWTKIRVPSCWEQEGFGTTQFGMPFYGKPNPPGIAKEQGKYRVEFTAPKEWEGKRVRIVFEGSMTDTHVRVNGISTGPAHQGGFYRFKRELTPLLKLGGTNQLEITVDKESANESVNLAERRADYWNFGGIFRPVWLEVLPALFIERTAIDARADGTFSADVFLGDAIPAGADVRIRAEVFDLDGHAASSVFEAAPAAGSDRATLRAQVPRPKLWTAETPNLYRVKFTLLRDGQEVHTTWERCGFRTFEVREGAGLFLNGQRVLMKGVNRHSFRPETGRTLNRAANYEDVRLIREMNMNAVRLSHYPADPEFLEACDELGLYVLNELGGWHGKYDTGAGKPLVASLVQRDVNHPSVIFWDNGNEGGWNPELDAEFAKWDPQQRPVLHPQKKFSGIDTMHYRSYGETQEFLRAPELFMPTEFLHGLFDGGAGAGLHDYWEMLRTHPRSGGGFIWALADEGLLRADQGGKIDCAGNYAPDGIVGPHHEREASFYTVREVWSPVVVRPLLEVKSAQADLSATTDRSDSSDAATPLPANFSGKLRVANRYDFTNLAACRFAWELGHFPTANETATGHSRIAAGEIAGPDVAPHAVGELTLPLLADWRGADVLYLSAKDPAGKVLWTWSWSVAPLALRVSAGTATSAAPGAVPPLTPRATPDSASRGTGLTTRDSVRPSTGADTNTDSKVRATADDPAAHAAGQGITPALPAGAAATAAVTLRDEANLTVITAGATELRFDRTTGFLANVSIGGKPLSLGRGPRFIAARRGDRTLDGSIDREAPAKGVDRVYNDISGEAKLTAFHAQIEDGIAVVDAQYFGALRSARWRISPEGVVRLSYEYGYDGVVELMGVQFDYPESAMRSIRWLGRGPYRVWQNRLHGTTLDVWQNAFNDPIPGESWIYPEFKGYFHDWRWADFTTSEGRLVITNGTPGSFLGVFTPRDGRTAELYTLPQTGLAVFDVIPAVRNKVNATDLVSPSSQAQRVSGVRSGSLEFRFEAK